MGGLEAGKGSAMPPFHLHSPFPLGCDIPLLGNVGFSDVAQTSLESRAKPRRSQQPKFHLEVVSSRQGFAGD